MGILDNERLKSHLLITAMVLTIIATRLPALFEPILNIDEADFAVQTATWMNGGIPYIDFVEKKPPLIHLAYALAFSIGGIWNMMAVHILFIGIVIFTGLILARCSWLLSGRKAEIASIVLFSVYQAGYDLNDFLAANTETLMNLFAAAACLSALANLNARRRFCGMTLTAAMTGIAALAKPVAIAFIPAILMASFLSSPRANRFRSFAGDVLAICLGFAIPLTATAILLAKRGALDDAVRWVWAENIDYASAVQPLSQTMAHGLKRMGIFIAVSMPLWVLALGYIFRSIRNKKFQPADAMLSVWILFTFATVSLGGRFFPHYFLQFLPPLVILAASGWTTWLSWKLPYGTWTRKAAVSIGLIIPLLGFSALHIVEVIKLPKKFRIEREIGKFLKENISSDSPILVWGHNSDIYFYSRKLSATRFAYCSYVTGSHEGYESYNTPAPRKNDARRLFMEDLAENPPEAVVDMSGTGIRGYDAYPIDGFPDLMAILQSGYAEQTNIHGARIWRKIGAMDRM